MTAPSKDYQIVRYFKSGFRPELIKDGLTLEEALAICRVSNMTTTEGEIMPRLWIDIAQKRGLL